MTNVQEITTANFDKANINIIQARALLNMLVESGDDGSGSFNNHNEALQVIYASIQMVDEVVRLLETTCNVAREICIDAPETSGM
jgi:hypothetical protein